MRVLAMAHAYPPHHNAGAEMTLHAMLGALRAAGHEVHVLLSRESPAWSDYEFEGIAVHPRRTDADPFPWFNSSSTQRADVVLTHLENTPRASALGDMFRIPVVQVLHNDHLWTKRALYRQAPQLAVFNTEWMAESFGQWWRGQTARNFPRSMVVHPAVDLERFTPSPGAGSQVVLVNMNEDKGGDLFWRLAARMPKRQFHGVRGAYGEQIVPDRPPPNVLLSAHKAPEHMPGVYDMARVVLMPSSYESYGRVGIEALASGVPVIAHPTPGLREALGEAGVFVDRDDIEGWQAEIERLFQARAHGTARLRARSRIAELTPDKDLLRFVDEVERTARHGTGLPR